MQNKNTVYLHKVCKYVYLCSAPNFWSGRLDLPDIVMKLFDRFYSFNSIVLCVFISSEFISYLTQKQLTEKQSGDLMMFCVSHALLYSSYAASVALFRENIKSVVHHVASLTEIHNDEKVEKNMIKKSKIYGVIYLLYITMVVVTFGIEGIVQASKPEATFTTVITAWPQTTDTGTLAGIVRIIAYIIWILYVMRQSALYYLVLVVTIYLSHQYKNLQCYFYGLNQIFERELDQSAKEAIYEKSLKIGVKLHAETLRCTREAQKAFQILYCGQVCLSLTVLTLQMVQLTTSERSISKALTTLSTASAVMFVTGMFMWNAGDITVEASRLPGAMFHSGWQNCRGANGYRVRKLLVLAMAQGQVPVVIKVLGILEFSYASYVTIVKTSYSVFSVLY